MYPVTREFLQALYASHSAPVKVTAMRNEIIVPGAESLNVLDGSVKVDYSAKIRRQLDGLKIASPDGTTDYLRELLGVGSTELYASRGIRFPNGRSEMVPIGRFRIDEMADDISQSGVLDISAQDISARIVDDRFPSGRGGTSGMKVIDQIAQLIHETMPGALVLDSTNATATIPVGVVWDRERWDACCDLAAGLGAVCYADQHGDFRIEPVPLKETVAVWTIHPGQNGTLISGSRSATRAGVFNVVVMSSNPTEGTIPVTAIAEDLNPSSPTYIHGPFGRVPVFRTSNTARTPAQVKAAADAYLQRSVGRRGALEVTCIVNPALEGGDRIDIVMPEGGVAAHIADSFSIPLRPGEPMSITTRVVSPLEEGDA